MLPPPGDTADCLPTGHLTSQSLWLDSAENTVLSQAELSV